MPVKNVLIENADIGFRNFSGKEGKFNPEGRRNFCWFMESDVANQLQEDGWNIKWLDPKEEGDEPRPYMQVGVTYANFPPNIVMVTSHGKTLLDDSSINILDWAEIEKVDMVIRPYEWAVNGKTGMKAYVKQMYVTIVEDPLADKYYDAPDSASEAIGGCGHCEVCDGSCKSGAH